MRTLLCAGYFLSTLSLASRSEASYLRSVLHSSTPLSLKQVVESGRSAKIIQSACDTQLKARMIPTACYIQLSYERRRGQTSAGEAQKQTELLNRLCIDRVRTAQSLPQLKSASQEALVAPPCLAALAERIADLRYQAELSHPEILFAERPLHGSEGGLMPRVTGPDFEK